MPTMQSLYMPDFMTGILAALALNNVPTLSAILRTSVRGPAKRRAADGLLGYVSQRHEMILYPEFAAKGWQIGSGPTKATCKTLTARLKGSGMRWDPSNAEALMALEALSQSGLGKDYWQTLLPKPA
jgi:hypothetical protein